MRVTRNAALDELRRRRVKRTEPVGHLHAPPADALGAAAPLFTALRGLPTSQREVAVLRLVVGLSPAETASRLERTEASVNNLYLRARVTLRRVLTGLGAAPTTVRSAQDGSAARTGSRDERARRPAGTPDGGRVRMRDGARRPGRSRPLRPGRRASSAPVTRLAAGRARGLAVGGGGVRGNACLVAAPAPGSPRAAGPCARSPPARRARAGMLASCRPRRLTPTVSALAAPSAPDSCHFDTRPRRSAPGSRCPGLLAMSSERGVIRLTRCRRAR
jgi:hypothetical protein